MSVFAGKNEPMEILLTKLDKIILLLLASLIAYFTGAGAFIEKMILNSESET